MKNGIMIVGDCLSEKDMRSGKPFTDGSGYVLDKILSAAGIRRKECHTTCVIYDNAPGGIERAFCGTKSEGIPGRSALFRGKYLRAEYQTQLDRLRGEVERLNPVVVVAAGTLALWALTGQTGIKKFRGTPLPGLYCRKVIPVWAPLSIIRQWTLRPVTIADFTKVKTESTYPEIRRPKRIIYLEPSLSDIEWFYNKFITPESELSIDIETSNKTITEVGIAVDKAHALVIPFYSRVSKDKNYWPDFASEREAWNWVARFCSHKAFGQNFQYDIKFLWKTVGIPMPQFCDDTMILHHSLQPELDKGLGFLASVYTMEASWKLMRHDHATQKKHDE